RQCCAHRRRQASQDRRCASQSARRGDEPVLVQPRRFQDRHTNASAAKSPSRSGDAEPLDRKSVANWASATNVFPRFLPCYNKHVSTQSSSRVELSKSTKSVTSKALSEL